MSKLSLSSPIAVFDSGLGGLTVVAAIHRKLPNENIVFLADRARVPYASLSPALIRKYALESFDFMMRLEPKALVVACNTVSAVCIDDVRSKHALPVVDVITPTARAAAKATKNNRIGVLATAATVKRRAYDMALNELLPSVEVISEGCPLLVPLVEDGWTTGEIPKKIVEHYLESILRGNADTIVLGCTHYEYFRELILEMSGGKTIVDTPLVTSEELAHNLSASSLNAPADSQGSVTIYSTDITDALYTIVKSLFGKEYQSGLVQIKSATLAPTPALT